jgi:hypothetical protein
MFINLVSAWFRLKGHGFYLALRRLRGALVWDSRLDTHGHGLDWGDEFVPRVEESLGFSSFSRLRYEECKFGQHFFASFDLYVIAWNFMGFI